MTYQTIGVAVVAVLFFAIRYLNRTDIPKIKGIPEIPGVPIFGNLLQLGEEHAKNAVKWVKQYGPVFQVRLGNRVCATEQISTRVTNGFSPENYLRQLLRQHQASLDHQPIRSYLPAHSTHFPYRSQLLPRLHDRHISMGRVL